MLSIKKRATHCGVTLAFDDYRGSCDLLIAKLDGAVGGAVDGDGGLFAHRASEELLGEGIEDITLDGALDGSGSEGGVVAFLGEGGDGGIGDTEG